MPSEIDQEEFERVYNAQFQFLVRVAFLLTGSAAEAEDVVHDSFVRCASRFGSIEHPRSYLRTVVVNECRSRFKRRERERRIVETPGQVDLPHDLVETKDALAALSGRKRTVIVLRYFVDLPDQEIAEILGCRPSTVRSLAHRALRELKENLQ